MFYIEYCDSNVTFMYVARVVINLITALPVFPPMEVTAERTAADEAVVEFDMLPFTVYNIRYYFANDTDLVCVHFHIALYWDIFSHPFC